MSESLLNPSFNPFFKTTGIKLMMRRFLIAYKHTAIAISAILEVVNEYAILNLDAVFVIELMNHSIKRLIQKHLAYLLKFFCGCMWNYFT